MDDSLLFLLLSKYFLVRNYFKNTTYLIQLTNLLLLLFTLYRAIKTYSKQSEHLFGLFSLLSRKIFQLSPLLGNKKYTN